MPDLSPIANFSFGLLAIFVAFFITHEAMLKLGHGEYQINASLISVASYLMLCRPQVVDGVFQIDNGRIGAAGIMMGIVVGLFVAIVFHLYAKLHVLENNDTLPDFVSDWINNIIPITITLGLSMIFANVLKLDLYDILVSLFMPLAEGRPDSAWLHSDLLCASYFLFDGYFQLGIQRSYHSDFYGGNRREY